MATIQDIKQRAQQVKDATQIGENTANRVGGVLVDIADHLEQGENQLSSLLPMDEAPTPNSVKPVQSGGVFDDFAKQIMQQFGGRFGGIINLAEYNIKTVKSASFGTISGGESTIISKISSRLYTLGYSQNIIKKGTVIRFSATSTVSRKQSYGTTQIEPGEDIIGTALDHCYATTVEGQHEDWFIMPYDGYFFYSYYNQDWTGRQFKVIEPKLYEGDTFSTGEKVNDVGIDSAPTKDSDNLVKSKGVWLALENKMEIIKEDYDSHLDSWRSASVGNDPEKNNGLSITKDGGTTTISVLLSVSGVRFSMMMHHLSIGKYRLEFDYSAVDANGDIIELGDNRRFLGGNNATQYGSNNTAPFITGIKLEETFDNNIGHYFYEFEKTEETPTYFYRSIYVADRWNVGDVITITNVKLVRLINDITDWSKEVNGSIEKLNSESSAFTPSMVSGMLKSAADNPDAAFKYISVVPSADETYNALYRQSLTTQFCASGDYLKRLTYYPEFIVCGGQNVTIRYTGLNGIVVYELPYRPLGSSPIDNFSNREVIKTTALPSNVNEEFTGEETITLSKDCRRLAFVLGSTKNVLTKPSDIINNITEVVFPIPDLENLTFGEERQYDQLINAARQARFVKYTGARPSIGLLHYTDLHGDDVSVEQIKKFSSVLSNSINDIICTGDVVHYFAEGTASYPQGVDWWKNSGLPEKSLFVLGNHDLATPEETEYSPKEGSAAWDGKGKEWGYENYFAPYINGLGITMPTGNNDESSPYYHSCYWHKDYATAKVRLIGIDCMHRFDGIINSETGEIITSGERKLTAEQEMWLIEKLNETLDSENAAYGYHVMILCHYPLDDFSGNNKEWNDTEHEFDYNHKSTGGRVMNGRTNDVTSFHWKATTNYTAENKFSMRGRGTNESKANNNVGEIIKAWMEKGGKFIAWIAGHRHADGFWYPTKFPEILSVSTDQAGWLRGGSTSSRYVSLVSESYRLCANFYSIDTENGLFKIVRIGQNMDRLMNVINYLCYDYINKKVINES